MSRTENSNKRAAAERRRLYGLLGPLPDRNRPIRVRVREVVERGGLRIEKLRLDLNGEEDVPAYFVLPRKGRGPFPAILFNHSHGARYRMGKEELFRSAPYMVRAPYGPALARRGYAVLCIDHWAFGERHGEPEDTVVKRRLLEGRVLWGMRVYDSLRAIDYLASRPEVDAARIGTLGMSMGSTMAQWVGALDTRVRAVVDICCLGEYRALLDTGGIAGHGFYYMVPGILRHFTMAQVNALIAPRAHLALAGERDGLTPRAGLDAINRHLRAVYRAAGAPRAWRLERQPVGHQETPAMRAHALAWLDSGLCDARDTNRLISYL